MFIKRKLIPLLSLLFVIAACGEVLPPPDPGVAPASPTGLTATASDNEVQLRWNANQERNLVGYNVYRSDTRAVGQRLNSRPVNVTRFADIGLENGQEYFYAVTAVTTGGVESLPSEIMSATPQREQGRPRVLSSSPANGATNVPLSGISITAQMDLVNNVGIDTSTFSSQSARLEKVATGEVIPSRLNSSPARDSLVLTPNDALEAATEYRFVVTSSLRDESGAQFVPFSSTFTTRQEIVDAGPVAFEKVELPNPRNDRFTMLKIGPDGKLYAATMDGRIIRYPINQDGTLGAEEILTSLRDAEGGPRLLIGLTFDPGATANNLVVWTSHASFGFDRMPDWTGKITRLSGNNLQNVQDFVVGLPRSAVDHVTNGIAFGPDGAMYVPQGSNNSKGAPDNFWRNRPERLLTAAILRIDVAALQARSLPLDVKTEDGGTYDPFAPGAPVTIYATGVRNAYDLVWHSNGQLYAPTNGAGVGGNTPGTPNPLPDSCRNRIDAHLHGDYTGPAVPALENVTQVMPDYLFRIEESGYYGHPNPTRCEWVLNGGNPTSGQDPAQVNAYPVGVQPDRNYRGFATQFNLHASSNGVIEYKSDTFNGALRGKLLVVRFSAGKDIVALTLGGAADNHNVLDMQVGDEIPGFSDFLDPLSLVENPANGHIYVSEYDRPVPGETVERFPKISLLRPVTP